MLSILLAVAAAMGNATASVLQRKATTTHEGASALQLMFGLIRTPVWVGGIAAMGVGFLLQAAALAAAVFHRGQQQGEAARWPG